MIIFFTFLFFALIIAIWFFLASLLKSYSLNQMLFYTSIFCISLLLYIVGKGLNLIGFVIFIFLLLWSFWRIVYSFYNLSQAEESLFFKEDFEPKRQWLFLKNYAISLSLSLAPLVLSFLFASKKFNYAGFAIFLLVFGSLVWILGFLLEVLIVGQKIGLKNSAYSETWSKNGVWNFANFKHKFTDIFIWSGVALVFFAQIF